MTHAANTNLNAVSPWLLDDERDVSLTSPRFWLWTMVVGLTFFAADQDVRLLQGANWEEQVYSADEFGDRIAGGNLLRQAVYLSLGLVGVCSLASGRGRLLPWRDPLLITCTAFILWCLMSSIWSAHPEQSLRRGTLLVCVYFAALGLARQFSPREFLAMVFVISFSWFVFSFGLELALGRFQPTSENYRFSAIMHPNSQGVHAAILCLASVAILFDAARRHSFAGCALLASSVALLLTRSRTALLALIAALFVLWLARTGPRKLSWILVLAVTISGVALVAGFAGQDVENSVFDALLLGRNEDVSSLTGRVPLWTALSDFALQRPLVGYGYGAFWDPERTEHVADAAYVRGWNIPDAHSSYLDALLALGVLGAAALVIVLVLAIVRAVGRYRGEPNAANTFLLGLLTFGAVNALTESSLMEPSYFYFLTLCAVIQLTFSTAIEHPSKPLLPSRMRRMAIAVPPPN